MPMRRKQKKVQEFQSPQSGVQDLQHGGIYGQVTRLGDQTMQLQVADKLRIEIARVRRRRLPGGTRWWNLNE